MTTPTEPARPAARFRVTVEEGPPHGGLYELELTTTYRVIDDASGATVMSFTGDYAASFGDDGQWGEPTLSGVVKVELDATGQAVVVHHADGRCEVLALPG